MSHNHVISAETCNINEMQKTIDNCASVRIKGA